MAKASRPFAAPQPQLFASIAEGILGGTLEWGLVCGLLVIGTIAAISAIGPKIKTIWTNANAAIP